MSVDNLSARLSAICSEVDFELSGVDPSLLARLNLLAKYSETLSDGEQIVLRARAIFRHYETTKPAEAFGQLERRIVVLGCLFSDIGKTGPANADSDGQRLIAETFAVEGVTNDEQPMTQFLQTYFLDGDERVRRFVELGLPPEMSIREFWNLHSTWTLAILEAAGMAPEVIVAAAAHHLLDDVNPDHIVAYDQSFTRSAGENHRFDRAEKLIILLDKYDALRRRGGKNHDEAIVWLRERLARSRRFSTDAEFSALIADLGAVFSQEPRQSR